MTDKQSERGVKAEIAFVEREVALGEIMQDDRFGRHATPDGLRSLASSIKQHGLLNNPKLHQTGDKSFEIVSGRRRIEAAGKAGLTTIRADVASMPLTDEEILRFDLEDNREREDLHCVDETVQIARYVDIRADLISAFPDIDDPLDRVRSVLALAKGHTNFPHDVVPENRQDKPKRGRPTKTYSKEELDLYGRVETALGEVMTQTPASWLEHYLVPAIKLKEDDRRRAVEYDLSATEVERLPSRLDKMMKTGEPQKLSAKRWATPSSSGGWEIEDSGPANKKKKDASGNAGDDQRQEPKESADRKTRDSDDPVPDNIPTPDTPQVPVGCIALPVDLSDTALQKFSDELVAALLDLGLTKDTTQKLVGWIDEAFLAQVPPKPKKKSNPNQLKVSPKKRWAE